MNTKRILFFDIEDMEDPIEKFRIADGESISCRKRVFVQKTSKMLELHDETSHLWCSIKRKLRQLELEDQYQPFEILIEAYQRGFRFIERGEEIKNPVAWLKRSTFNIIRDLKKERFLSRRVGKQFDYSIRDDLKNDFLHSEIISSWIYYRNINDISPSELNKIHNLRVLWVQLFPVIRDWLIDKLPNVLQKRVGIFSQRKIMLRYKGYIASVRVDDENNTLVGKVQSINDLILFEGKDVQELKREFEKSVDSYLSLCERLGKLPDKKYSGKISYRTEEETHKEIAVLAAVQEMSINAWMDKAVKQQIQEETMKRANRVAALSVSLQ